MNIPISGSHLPTAEIQHSIRYQNRRRASEPFRIAENVGRSAQNQQELSFGYDQSRGIGRTCCAGNWGVVS